jgi:hypothetical protein
MSFGLYVLGYLIVIGGLTYGAILMHVPTHWIAVGVSCLPAPAARRVCGSPRAEIRGVGGRETRSCRG